MEFGGPHVGDALGKDATTLQFAGTQFFTCDLDRKTMVIWETDILLYFGSL